MSGDGGENATYNDANRAFLQAFIARSTMTYDQAKPILAAILTAYEGRETLPEDITEADFTSYVAATNHAISPLDLEIRSASHQTKRTRVYALVNSASDPIAQLATSYTADEIGFLKRVLDAMFETYNTPRHEVMAITSMQAIKLTKPPSGSGRRETQGGSETQGSAGQGITIREAEKMLCALKDQGWFEKSSQGYYSLGPRALMELRGWLIETYNDAEESEDENGAARVPKIKFCQACKDIVTVGQCCPKGTCPCRLHEICTHNFFRVQKSKKCPLCRSDWSGEDFVGEKAAASSASSGKRRRGGGSAARVSSPAVVERAKSVGNDDEDEEENIYD